MVAVREALIFGKICSSLANFTPSIVMRRPLTTTLLLARWTKRFTSWKKSARLKKFPTNSSSSGTVPRQPDTSWVPPVVAPGVAAPPPTGSPPPVEVEVVASTPDCDAAALAWFDVAAAFFAAPVAVPGALWAGAPPEATGGVVVPAAGVVPVLPAGGVVPAGG